MEGGDGIGFFGLLFGIALFVFFSYCLKAICEKANHDPDILIWIPLVQLIPMARIAGINPLLLLLYVVPFINVVFMLYHWAKVCIAIDKSPWLVILLLIPVLNLTFLPILAFA